MFIFVYLEQLTQGIGYYFYIYVAVSTHSTRTKPEIYPTGC